MPLSGQSPLLTTTVVISNSILVTLYFAVDIDGLHYPHHAGDLLSGTNITTAGKHCWFTGNCCCLLCWIGQTASNKDSKRMTNQRQLTGCLTVSEAWCKLYELLCQLTKTLYRKTWIWQCCVCVCMLIRREAFPFPLGWLTGSQVYNMMHIWYKTTLTLT